MTPGLVLDELDLNLSSSSFLVLWFLVVLVIVCSTVHSVSVIDKCIFPNAWMHGMSVLSVCWVSCHIHSGALSHEIQGKKTCLSSLTDKAS